MIDIAITCLPRWLKAELLSVRLRQHACGNGQRAEEHHKELQVLQHLCASLFLRALCHFRMSFTLPSVDYTCVCAVYLRHLEAGQHLDVLTKLRSGLECLDCRDELDSRTTCNRRWHLSPINQRPGGCWERPRRRAAVMERCPLCSEWSASGSELKVSSEVTADKVWLLDVAPEASAFSPLDPASSPPSDVSSLQPDGNQLPRPLTLRRLKHTHTLQETLMLQASTALTPWRVVLKWGFFH